MHEFWIAMYVIFAFFSFLVMFNIMYIGVSWIALQVMDNLAGKVL